MKKKNHRKYPTTFCDFMLQLINLDLKTRNISKN